MANIFNIATSGLEAFQRGLTITGDNIANVHTDGYSRKTIELASRQSTKTGDFFIGSGVDISTVARNTDYYAVKQVRDANSIFSGVSEYLNNSQSLDTLLSSDSASISTAMQLFFAKLQSVSANPNDSSTKQLLFTQCKQLADRFNSLNTQFDAQTTQLNNQLTTKVATLQTLTESLAKVNQQIISNRNVAPEVLDQRDRLVKEIASYVSVQVIENKDFTVNVSIGNGVALVTGSTPSHLVTIPSNSDPQKMAVALEVNNIGYQITDNISGGSIGGLLDYRDGLLQDTRNSVDRMALGFSEQLNNQHQLGMDSRGNLGKAIFTDINSTYLQQHRSTNNVNNQGTMALNVDISDATQLLADDYRLTVSTGPTYQLTRLSDNTTTTIASFPTTVSGFTISIASGTASVGDSFLISPNKNAASEMKFNLLSPNELAMASPVRGAPLISNTGTATLSPGQVVDTTTSAFATPQALSPPVNIVFLSPTSYQLVNATTSSVIEGPISYDPTLANEIFPTPGAYDPGYRFSISGAAQTADQFAIIYNTNGLGDNRNGAAISDIQNQKLLDNGSISIQNSYGALISVVGSETYQSQLANDASELLLQQSEARLEGIAGVSLDEEAANLLKYQQAYQAAAQIISIANRMFDDLLTIFR